MARSKRFVEISLGDGFVRGTFDAMGSPCEVLVATADTSAATSLAEIAANEAWRIEEKFSRYLPDNIVAAINGSNGRPVLVDDETAGLIDFSSTLYELSDGRFDITSGVLRRVWTFDGSDRIPSEADVDAIVANVGWHRVLWERPELTLAAGMQIDFGGVGKEYAVDRAARLVSEHSTASCLLNFGGDLAVAGPVREPQGWQVGIESLRGDRPAAGKRINLRSGALATSGDARRYLLREGKRFGHILDPVSGWPVEDAPRSITVAADTCTEAGMLATLAMLKGAGAEDWLAGESVRFWALR